MRTAYRNGDEITLGGCNGCSPSTINGFLCHETHCPDEWRDSVRHCFECGCDFSPRESFGRYCDDCEGEGWS